MANTPNVNQTLDPVSGGGTAERTFQMSRYLARNPEVEVSILTLDIGITEQRYRDLSAVRKVSIATTSRDNFVVGAQALHGYPYDEYTLNETVEQAGRLGRNYLIGQEGDRINAILCGVGHNIRKLLRAFLLFLFLWLLKTRFQPVAG